MFAEKTIGVCLKDHTNDRFAQVQLGIAKTIAQVRPQILERLVMPLEDESGEAITYAMYNESHDAKPYLLDNQYVGHVLSAGQTVRVVPEIIAGG